MVRRLAGLQTPFGAFEGLLRSRATTLAGPFPAGDLLPISLEALVEADLTMTLSGCAGPPIALEHEKVLNAGQEAMVERILRATRRLLSLDGPLPGVEDLKDLLLKDVGYSGKAVIFMEELYAEQVVACWPEVGQAAVQNVSKFLTGDSKRLVENPEECLLPNEEWPDKPRASKVRASDTEWNQIVAAAFERGMMGAVAPEETARERWEFGFERRRGRRKMEEGHLTAEVHSIFIPINEHLKKIRGAEATLPYHGQVGMLLIPDAGEVLIDSEDLESCFNLFVMPPSWTGWFVYEKQVPGHIVGFGNSQPTYVGLRTVPNGMDLGSWGCARGSAVYCLHRCRHRPKQRNPEVEETA